MLLSFYAESLADVERSLQAAYPGIKPSRLSVALAAGLGFTSPRDMRLSADDPDSNIQRPIHDDRFRQRLADVDGQPLPDDAPTLSEVLFDRQPAWLDGESLVEGVTLALAVLAASFRVENGERLMSHTAINIDYQGANLFDAVSGVNFSDPEINGDEMAMFKVAALARDTAALRELASRVCELSGY